MSRRHSSTTVAEAKRLAEAGWSAYQIAKLFRRRGISVDETTIHDWTDPKRAAERRRRHRDRARRLNAQRTGGRLTFGPARSPEFRAARILNLADEGLNARQIAIVMNFDFRDLQLTEDQVRYALQQGRLPAAEHADRSETAA